MHFFFILLWRWCLWLKRVPVKSCDRKIVSAASGWWSVWAIRVMSKDTEHYSITQCPLFLQLNNPNQTEPLCSLSQTRVCRQKCRGKQANDNREKQRKMKERENMDRKPKRDRTKGNRGQVYQSVSTLQRLNGLMTAKCCDLGTQSRFKAVPGTHKLL